MWVECMKCGRESLGIRTRPGRERGEIRSVARFQAAPDGSLNRAA
jgi:hypothetical protein